METINNYTSPSERFFLEEIKSSTSTTFFYDAFFITITSQELEHPWAVKILILELLRNVVLAFYKVNKLLRNLTQAPWQCGHE